MPPKVKIQKDQIIRVAIDLIRAQGAQAVNARNIAAALNCSTQPIFSNFANMDELRLAVVNAADALYREYMQRELESSQYPPYKASGMAYIRFAKEEKELFKFLYMRDRSGETFFQQPDLNTQMENIVQNNVGLDSTDAKLFHLEMWAYVHGIAAMTATGFLDLDWELVSRMLTDSYQGLKTHYEKR